MSTLVEDETLEELDFKWGKQRGVGGKKKNVRFYETFTYDEMDYALYDCVFMYTKDEPAPHIGKLVKIWENSDKSKKVKVQWFFRPWEISFYLGDAEFMKNELFFASGVGTGLTNINPLEAIAGKCNIVCISKDSRNLQPSAEEVQMADYIFYRTFDVKSNTISDQMGDTIGGLDVKYVFNRTESLRALDACNLNPNCKDVIACGETSEASGKNLLVHLKNVKPDENEDLMLGKEGTNVNEVGTKHGGLLGEGSLDGNVKSRKIELSEGISLEKKNMPDDKNGSDKDTCKDIKSPVQLKNVKPDENEYLMLGKEGTNVNEVGTKHGGLLGEGSLDGNVKSRKIGLSEGISLEKKNMPDDKNGSDKDRCKDIKSPVSQVKVVEGVKKSARDSGDDLDYSRSKRAKLDGPLSSIKVKDVKRPRNLTSPGKDVSEHDKNLDGSKKDVNLAEKSRFLDENLSKTNVASGKKTIPTSGHAEDLSALQGKQTNGNNFLCREKTDSAQARDFVGSKKGKKTGENLSSHMERSPSEAERTVTPNGTSKSETNNSFQGYGQDAKLIKNLNASTKRTLKRSNDLSRSNTRNMADYVDKLADDSSLLGGGPPTKKGKFDDTANKLSEKNCSDEVNNSSRLVDIDNTTRSKLDKGASKEHLEGGPSKKGKFDDSYCKDNVIENVKEKNCLGNINNLPKVAAHENNEKLKLGKDALKENFNDKAGKPSKNNLLNCNGDDGKVGSQIFEVTPRPIVEKSNWMKLPWANKMNTAHEQGRLVLLQNLDPEYTSGEVEDIVWHAFKEESTAKMIQQTATSNPYSGQAFVIFKSREAVDRVVKKLEGGCLMLPNKRPLVARILEFPNFLQKQTFIGHLAIDKAKRQREMNEAVSTSHYSQNNTIEYEMAMAWCHLHSKSDSWWKKLYEQQRKEIKKLAANLKSK